MCIESSNQQVTIDLSAKIGKRGRKRRKRRKRRQSILRNFYGRDKRLNFLSLCQNVKTEASFSNSPWKLVPVGYFYPQLISSEWAVSNWQAIFPVLPAQQKRPTRLRKTNTGTFFPAQQKMPMWCNLRHFLPIADWLCWGDWQCEAAAEYFSNIFSCLFSSAKDANVMSPELSSANTDSGEWMSTKPKLDVSRRAKSLEGKIGLMCNPKHARPVCNFLNSYS